MPSELQVDKALALIQKGGGNYEYFFEQLSKPSWIAPLAKRGRFNHPPPLVRVSESAHRIPAWPEGQYLVRMAAVAPDEVASVVGPAAYESDNPLVHTLLLEIASFLPAIAARNLVGKEIEWLEKQRSLYALYPQRAADLVVHLITVGEVDTAMHFTRTLLQVWAPESSTVGKPIEMEDGSTFPYRPSPHPKSRLDPSLAQMFKGKALAPLTRAGGARFIRDLAENLNAAVDIHCMYYSDKTDDHSSIWRPYVDHRSHHDVLDEVVSSLADAIQMLVTEEPGAVVEVPEILSRYTWPIFARLNAFTLRVAPQVDSSVLSAFVHNRERFSSTTANPEFRDLLTARATELPAAIVGDILKWINQGPDLSGYEEHWASRGTPHEVASVREAITEQWQLDWLSTLAPLLTGASRTMLDQLQEKRHPSETHVLTHGGPVSVQDMSPTDLSSFNAMSVDEILRYLREWVPPANQHPFEQQTRSGLASTLSAWVTEDPVKASVAITEFLADDLDPTYITAILGAFTSLLKDQREFDVYAVAAAARWVAENTDATQPQGRERWDRVTWNWAHMAAARFMAELMLKTDRLDLQRAGELFGAVCPLCHVPRPTPEDEKDYKKHSSRYASLALNSPRPVGVEAMIRYGRWIRLAAPTDDVRRQLLQPVFDVLKEKLDSSKDSSVAVREMFGMQFSLLAWLDPDWFNSVIPRIFPGKRALDQFAWNAYLLYGRPVASTVPAMRHRYGIAISKLNKNATDVAETDRTLATHLIHFYASGAIEVDDPLLVSFFASAAPILRKQALGDIGWRIGQEKRPLTDEVRARLMALLEHRLQVLKDARREDGRELESFGWWGSSGAFPEPWLVARSMEILEKQHSLSPDFAVAEAFSALSARYPYEAIRVVHELLAADEDGWSIHGWSQHLDTILKNALSDGEKARSEATAMIDSLAARGFRGYRRMLAPLDS